MTTVSQRLLPAVVSASLVLIAACGPSSCGTQDQIGLLPTSPPTPGRFAGRTTDGAVVLRNLDAEITKLERLAAAGKASVRDRAVLAERVALRGRHRGRVSDYTRSLELSEQLVREHPGNGRALLARARAHANLHQFAEAGADLERARQLGLRGAAVESLQAAILQAQGRYDEALTIRQRQLETRHNILTLTALGALHAARGETREAEDRFTDAALVYHGVSPYPVVALLVEEGQMRMHLKQYDRARAVLVEAQQRMPQFVVAQGLLAQAEAALGNRDRAIALLLPLAKHAEDPIYAAQLARVLGEAGNTGEAARWRSRAAASYERLLERYPAAFAEPAAEFWLGAGADPKRALVLTQQHLQSHQTPTAYELVVTAALAAGEPATACAAARSAPSAMALVPDAERTCSKGGAAQPTN